MNPTDIYWVSGERQALDKIKYSIVGFLWFCFASGLVRIRQQCLCLVAHSPGRQGGPWTLEVGTTRQTGMETAVWGRSLGRQLNIQTWTSELAHHDPLELCL